MCIYILLIYNIYIDINTLRKIGPWINVKNRWLLSCFRTFSERVQWFFAKNFEPRLGMIGHDWAIWICLKAGYTLQIAMLMRKWWWITEWGWEMLKNPRCSDAKPLRNLEITRASQKMVPRQHTWASAPLALHPASWAKQGSTQDSTWLNTTQPSIPAGPNWSPNCRFHALMPPAMRTMLLQSAPSSTKYLQPFFGDFGDFQGPLSVSLPRSLRNVPTSRHVATVHIALDAGILSHKLQVQGLKLILKAQRLSEKPEFWCHGAPMFNLIQIKKMCVAIATLVLCHAFLVSYIILHIYILYLYIYTYGRATHQLSVLCYPPQPPSHAEADQDLASVHQIDEVLDQGLIHLKADDSYDSLALEGTVIPGSPLVISCHFMPCIAVYYTVLPMYYHLFLVVRENRNAEEKGE